MNSQQSLGFFKIHMDRHGSLHTFDALLLEALLLEKKMLQHCSLHPGLQRHNSEDSSKQKCGAKIGYVFHFYYCLLPHKERYYKVTLEVAFNVPQRLLRVELVISSLRDAAHNTTFRQGSLRIAPIANPH